MANPVELWISTFNEGKLREFKELFKDQPVEVFSASELRHYSSPPETGDSFYANADIKARALKALKPQTWVLADDSGLEVPGLGGLPGIHSSRYAGEKAQASENNAKLLKMISLRSAQKREAQFRCTLVAYSPDGESWTGDGVMKGQIAQRSTGSGGFGYDPVFIPEGETETLGVLPPSFKIKKSHRAQAFQDFKEYFISKINAH